VYGGKAREFKGISLVLPQSSALLDGLLQPTEQPTQSLLLGPCGDHRVVLQQGRGLIMAGQLHHGLDVHATGQQHGSEGLPEIVQVGVLQLGFLYDRGPKLLFLR